MDLNELKNLDVKELISKVKGLEIMNDKKALTKFGIGFGAVFLSVFFYYIFVAPTVKDQKGKIAQMSQNQTEIQNFKTQIEDLKVQVKNIEPEYEKNSKLFHSKKEVEGLYQSISNFALANSLSIVNLKKGDPTPAGGANPDQNNQGDNTNTQDDPNAQEGSGGGSYYTIPVDYEIRGTFLGYLKFRRALSKSMKVINFDSEEINLLKAPRGQVLSKGTISIVGLPDEYK